MSVVFHGYFAARPSNWDIPESVVLGGLKADVVHDEEPTAVGNRTASEVNREMTEVPAVAIVGVGNPIMGDDGVGERIVEVLHEAGLPPGVEATHAGTTAFLALEALSGADRGIVVDAVSDGDADPGTVHRYRVVDDAFEGEPPDVFMHDFSFSEAIQAGSDAYDLPSEVVVLGVEPADTSPGLGLSDPVEASLPSVVEAVSEEVGRGGGPTLPEIEQSVQINMTTHNDSSTTENGR